MLWDLRTADYWILQKYTLFLVAATPTRVLHQNFGILYRIILQFLNLFLNLNLLLRSFVQSNLQGLDYITLVFLLDHLI